MQGLVHSVETFGTVDGPGLRYVLFLKNCPFKCLFCHNPDTWANPCKTYMDSEEIISYIISHKNFYKNGGITITGGEPLLQKEFCIDIFKKCKENNIHTCLDTCGHSSINNELKELLEYTDLVLLDIKSLDKDKHIEMTGKTNNLVLKFLNYLNDIHKKTVIRLVLLPEYNMDDEYIKRLILFLKKYKNIEYIELLPFHNNGSYKWKELGLKYKLKNHRIPTNEEINHIKELFEKNNFKILI